MPEIFAHQFKLSEHTNQRWRVNPDAGTSLESLLKNDAWKHVASKLAIGDIIEVAPVDGSYFAMLYVRDCAKQWAKVAVIAQASFEGAAAEEVSIGAKVDEYEAKWAGPAAKWRVHRKSDGAVVSNEAFADRESADAWLIKFAREQAA